MRNMFEARMKKNDDLTINHNAGLPLLQKANFKTQSTYDRAPLSKWLLHEVFK